MADVNTSIREMFRNVSLVEFEPLAPGRCETIAEVYENIVRPNELPTDLVLDWWSVLKRYVAENDCTFFIRKFEHDARRGFYTRDSAGVGFAYCGNPFAEYFLTMVKAGFNPVNRYDEFRDFLSPAAEDHIKHGNREDKKKGENPQHQAYRLGPRTKMGSRGWYLAHIFSVADEGDFVPRQNAVANGLFVRGNLDEWCMRGDHDYPYRDIGRCFSKDEREVLTARFLRFVNPMNFFLVPKNRGGVGNRKLQKLVIDGQDYKTGIGECKWMTKYMRYVQHCRFGRDFEEFEKLAMVEHARIEDLRVYGSKHVDLEYWR